MTKLLRRREFLTIPEAHQKSEVEESSRAVGQQDVARSTDSYHLGKLKVWVTDERRRLESAADIEWTTRLVTRERDSIVLLPAKKFQEILGFGATFTDASCYLFNQLATPVRSRLFHTLFHPSEMGLNVCRTSMGSSDCSTSTYSYNDGELDPDLSRFSIEHDRAYILPMLREARGINPDLFLISSPWSPPGWMKSNGSLLGGCMRHTYMPSYANYFLKFLRSYEREGVPVQAVTLQNEVDTDRDGSAPACAWPQDYEADFLTMHLGPLLQRSGLKTRIWIIDHNYNLWGRAIGELETPDVRKYTNAIAWHGYAGEPELISRVQNAFPDVEMYWTEGGPDHNSPEYLLEWARWGQTFISLFRNCCRSITARTFVTDELGRPYQAKDANGVGGVMMVDSQTKNVSYSGMFWALAHFSRLVRRGARRIESQGMGDNLFHCVFENPGGSLTVVISNRGPARTCEIELDERMARVPLPANSLVTLTASRSTMLN